MIVPLLIAVAGAAYMITKKPPARLPVEEPGYEELVQPPVSEKPAVPSPKQVMEQVKQLQEQAKEYQGMIKKAGEYGGEIKSLVSSPTKTAQEVAKETAEEEAIQKAKLEEEEEERSREQDEDIQQDEEKAEQKKQTDAARAEDVIKKTTTASGVLGVSVGTLLLAAGIGLVIFAGVNALAKMQAGTRRRKKEMKEYLAQARLYVAAWKKLRDEIIPQLEKDKKKLQNVMVLMREALAKRSA